jgi:hypothetical protein
VSETETFASRLLAALHLDDQGLTTTQVASIPDDAFISHAVSTVFDCLARPSALSTNMRLLHGGQEVPRELWSTSRISHGQVIHTELIAPFIDEAVVAGDLIVIDSVDECDPLMMSLREAVEYGLSARAWINVYLTATSTSSFGPHSDDMDTIIFQLLGRKCWTVAPSPGAGHDGFPAAASTLELSPGSALAVPAGTFHDVKGLGELALHLTIGFDHEAGIGRRLRALDQLRGEQAPDLSGAELRIGKAMLPDRRVGSSAAFRATREAQHCRFIKWASRLPPVVRVMDDGGLDVLSMGRQLRFACEYAATIQALATGGEFGLDALVGISGLERAAVVSFLLDTTEEGLIICRV